MSRSFVIFTNLLLFAFLAILIPGIDYRSSALGDGLAMIVAGIIWGFAHLFVEPAIKFFKFPINGWSLFFASFIVNLVVLAVFALGLIPQVVTINTTTFGSNLAPIPLGSLALTSPLATVIFSAILGALLQLILRRLAKS